MTHRMLAKWPEETARAEMADSKAALEARLGREVGAFAYPVGDATSAGPREFELARQTRLLLRGDDASGHALSPSTRAI